MQPILPCLHNIYKIITTQVIKGPTRFILQKARIKTVCDLLQVPQSNIKSVPFAHQHSDFWIARNDARRKMSYQQWVYSKENNTTQVEKASTSGVFYVYVRSTDIVLTSVEVKWAVKSPFTHIVHRRIAIHVRINKDQWYLKDNTVTEFQNCDLNTIPKSAYCI